MEDTAAEDSSPDQVSSLRDSSYTGNTPLPGTLQLTCTHYERHCAFVTPCCQKLYICRLCHNEQENHELNRHAVMEVQCLACEARQPVGSACLRCGASFGRYFCEICRMYDDRDKKQFHCDACGICRVGGRDQFFHCPKCDMCLGKDLEGSHHCVERVTHSNCPICLEDLHTSVANLRVLTCGHITHSICYKDMLNKGMYACPCCGTSTSDMSEYWTDIDVEIANTPMPEEYRDFKVWILCKDCHETTEVLFHVIGLKCSKCGSYNTCRTGAPEQHRHAASADVASNGAYDAEVDFMPGTNETLESSARLDAETLNTMDSPDNPVDARLALASSAGPDVADGTADVYK